jgi:Flp pilus assembly protein TadD
MAQAARTLLPDEPHTADTFGWILYKKGQYARAVGMLEESAAALPNEPDVQYHLGMARYVTGLEQPAIDAFERALELNPKIDSAAEIQQRLAVLSLDRNAPTESSIAKLEKLIADSPKDSVALSRLGALYESVGAGDKAFAAYQAAIQANASSAAPWMGLARVYLSRDDTSNALDAAKTARKLAPGDDSVAQSLGNIAHRAGDSAWAASLLQEAARGRPDDPGLLFETAQVLYSVGRLDDARETMSNAVGLFDRASKSSSGVQMDNGTHHADAARSFLEMIALSKEPASPNAEAKIRNALNSNPNDAPALMALGALNEYKSDFAEAQRAYEQVLARHPELAAAKRNYAILSSANTTFEPRAYEWGMQARMAYPSDAKLTRALAILTYRKGDNDARAVTILQQGTETHPQDAELAYYLGMVQLRMKENVKARESLEKAISLGLAPNLAADARKRLEELK